MHERSSVRTREGQRPAEEPDVHEDHECGHHEVARLAGLVAKHEHPREGTWPSEGELKGMKRALRDAPLVPCGAPLVDAKDHERDEAPERVRGENGEAGEGEGKGHGQCAFATGNTAARLRFTLDTELRQIRRK